MSLGKGLLLVALVFAAIAVLIEVLKPQQSPVSSLLLFEISYFFLVLAFFVGI